VKFVKWTGQVLDASITGPKVNVTQTEWGGIRVGRFCVFSWAQQEEKGKRHHVCSSVAKWVDGCSVLSAHLTNEIERYRFHSGRWRVGSVVGQEEALKAQVDGASWC